MIHGRLLTLKPVIVRLTLGKSVSILLGIFLEAGLVY
jgi:hypothetical protein